MNTYPVNLELRNSVPQMGPVSAVSLILLAAIVCFSPLAFMVGAYLIGLAMIIIPLIGIGFLMREISVTLSNKALRRELEKERRTLQAYMKANYQLELSILQTKDLFCGYDVTVTRNDSTEVTINLSDKGVFVVKGETIKLPLNSLRAA